MPFQAALGGLERRPHTFFFLSTAAPQKCKNPPLPAGIGIAHLQVAVGGRERLGASGPNPGARGARTAP